MHAVRGCGTGGGFGGYTAEGGSGEEVRGANQVVGVVLENVRLGNGEGRGIYHVFGIFREEGDGAGAVALDVLLYESHGEGFVTR